MTSVALITGGAKRIGAAIARQLHRSGYDLLLHYLTSSDQAEQLASELHGLRPNSAHVFQADLSTIEQVTGLANWVRARGGIDVLVNNASLFYAGKVGQVTEQDWDNLLAVNLKAPFFLSQALASPLAEKQGCIINIVDIHAERGLLDFPVYSIAKAGLVAMTKCLAKELAPNVRVNAVAPGAILWPEHPLDDEVKAGIVQKIALQRYGEVDDIAKAVWFLAEEANYVTGHVLTVDGGRMLFS
ncbi:pteridine reductase [Methylomonas sp. MgM2]